MSGTSAARTSVEDMIPKILAHYGVSAKNDSEREKFVVGHIEILERAENQAVARTGSVLRRAFDGYGLGYKIPLAVIAIGQEMLGINLAVAAPFVTANPAAFTCAAVGAIYFGYQALDEPERAALFAKIGKALQFGVELVKSIVEFCIDSLRSIFDKENLAIVKAYVAEFASAMGSSLAEITGKLSDRISAAASGALSGAGALAINAGSAVTSVAGSAYEVGSSYFSRSDGSDKK